MFRRSTAISATAATTATKYFANYSFILGFIAQNLVAFVLSHIIFIKDTTAAPPTTNSISCWKFPFPKEIPSSYVPLGFMFSRCIITYSLWKCKLCVVTKRGSRLQTVQLSFILSLAKRTHRNKIWYIRFLLVVDVVWKVHSAFSICWV